MSYNKKSLKRTVLDSISPLLNKVPEDKLFLVYPALYDALIEKKLIPEIKKPTEKSKPVEKNFEMPVYPWQTEQKKPILHIEKT